MRNRSEAYPIRNITFEEVSFRDTDLGKGGLGDVLDSIQEGTNIWVKLDGAPMIKGMCVYNKELLPGIFLVAFDTEEARNYQIEASKLLDGKDTGKYTVPDITTFFEIEKDGKKLYCYVVDRMDMWKHKKDMLMGEIDSVSIDGVIVYPSGLLRADGEIIQVRDDVSGILSTGKNF